MIDCCFATLTATARSVLLALLVVSGVACTQPDTVLSVDKQMLEFTLRSRLETQPCTDTTLVPEGTCTDDETEKLVSVSGVPSPKTIRLNNSGTESYVIAVSIAAVPLAEGQDPSTWPAADRSPFEVRAQTAEDDTVSTITDWTTSGLVSIKGRSEVEIQVRYQGSMLDRAGLEAAGFSAAAGTIFPNNQRLILRLADADGTVRTDADGAVLWEGAPSGIVLRGTVDCQSLGWDEDRDGFCDESSLAAFETAGDCEDTPGLLGYSSNPDGDEACEEDAEGDISVDQVDNDCDGFRIRNGDNEDTADQDGDGVCDFTRACVPDFGLLSDEEVLAFQAELQSLCGSSLEDCDDNPVNGALNSPLNPELCEPGSEADQIDTNCDESDDSDGLTWFAIDEDADGFAANVQPQIPESNPVEYFPIRFCGPPEESVTLNRNITICGGDGSGFDCGDDDCDDSRAITFPGAPEICDGQDNDCDPATTLPGDEDNDNDGQAACENDCDDNNNDVKVGAPEICDGQDNNCTGGPDSDEVDDDGDNYFQCEGVPFKVELQVALQPTNELTLFAALGLTLAEKQAITVTVQTGTIEDVTESGSVVTVTFVNTLSTTDSLNLLITTAIQNSSISLIGLVTGEGTHNWTTLEEGSQTLGMEGTLGDDCDDADPLINPGASEVNASAPAGAGFAVAFCDGQDNNCDGVLHPFESDDDLDGWAECTPSTQGGPEGEELILLAPAALTTGTPLTVSFATGASESVVESVGTSTVTVTFIDGTSSTNSLVTTITAALGGLTLINGVSWTDANLSSPATPGTTAWTSAAVGDVFMGLLAGGDCNDSSDEIALTLPELCDGFDNDCDGAIGDGSAGTPDERDLDADSYVECTPNSVNLGGTVLGMAGGDDCQDDPSNPNDPLSVAASTIYPGAPEVADSYYNAATSTYVLVDNQCPGDPGYDANGIPGSGEYCTAPAIIAGFSCTESELDLDGDNYSPANGDCDDTNDQIGPQMLEVCDGFDNDCDTVIPAWDVDDDGDDWLPCNPAPGVILAGSLVGGGDCDDANATVNPGEVELADGLDTDCDASTNDPGEVDGDADGYCPGTSCNGTLIAGDCDDGNASVNPGATELCDELDTDCDLLLSDGSSNTLDEVDDDGDGYTVCDPSNAAAVLDCLEHASQILAAFPSYPVNGSGVPVNYPAAAAAVFPFNPEICDGWNNDCSSGTGIPSATEQSDEFDDDGDGFVDCLDSAAGAVGWTTPAIVAQANQDLSGANDCADIPADADDPSNPNDGPTAGPLTTIYPGATELCDGWDNTCLGSAPPFVGPNSPEWDDDLDRYLDCSQVTITTGAVNTNGDTIIGGYDCLDDPSTDSETPSGLLAATGATVTTAMAAAVNPGQAEVCDAWNTDCDTNGSSSGGETLLVLPTLADVPSEVDEDADLFVQCSNFTATGAAGMAGEDCLDVATGVNPYSGSVNPAASADTLANVATACDGWDTDCSNQPSYPDNDGEPCGDDGLCPGESGYSSADTGENALDEYDADDDGYIQCGVVATNAAGNGPSVGSQTQVVGGGDCLDTASNPRSDDVSPVANADTVANVTTACDGWDTDCSNQPAYPNNDGEPCGNDGLCPGESGYTSADTGEDALGEFDHDGDTYIECTVTATDAANNGPAVASQAQVISGTDCLDVFLTVNPYSDDVNPAATETCDSWDTDCDSQPAYPNNDGEPEDADELDQDVDLYVQCDLSAAAIVGGAVSNGFGGAVNGSDCLDVLLSANSYSDNVNPVATEVCDSWDTDCNSQPAYPNNDGLPEAAEEIDDDGDGYVQCDFSAAVLSGGAATNGYGGVTNGSDCLDVLLSANSYSDNVNPGETEICDSWDTDCSSQSAYPNNDGAADDADEVDDDADGYVPCDYSAAANSGGAETNGFGGVTDGGDCLDTTLASNAYSDDVNPAATETCDSWDTDCDSQSAYPANSGVPEDADELDQDADSYIQCDLSATAIAGGAIGNGFGGATNGSDCLDVLLSSNAYSDNVNPVATETCDSWDTDCDSQSAYPANDGEPEDADEIDDDGDLYIQCDFSAAALVGGAANNGFGGVLLGTDCLDVLLSANAYADNVNPSESETCDSWDTDCDSQPAYPNNDGAPEDADEVDDDGDTYIHCDFSSAANAGGAVNNGFGTVIDGSDCLDETTATNPYADNVNPSETEICDSYDTDCDSQAAYPGNDGEPEDAEELDQDNDGYAECDYPAAAISGGAINNGYNWDTATQTVLSGSDCLDVLLTSNSYSDDVSPAGSADPVCDSWDTDCDSQPAYPGNDGTPEDSDELDDDSDGYFECTLIAAAVGNTRNSALGDDCLDVTTGTFPLNTSSDPSITAAQAAAVNPGATEACDGFDTDCSSGNSTFVVDSSQEPNEFDADLDDHMICTPIESYTPVGLLGGDCDNVFGSGTGINPSVAPDDASAVLTDNDCDGLYDEDAYSAGNLAITELMVAPTGGDSQWFEVVNQSGRTLSLEGIVISDQGSDTYTLTEATGDPNNAPLQIVSGDFDIICLTPANYSGGTSPYATSCLNANAMTNFSVESAADEVVLTLDGTSIDVVAWTTSASSASDASTTLDPSAAPNFQTANNTLDLNSSDWCGAFNVWTDGGGGTGSPGLANQSCDSDNLDLDGDGFCVNGFDAFDATGAANPDGDCDDASEASSTVYDCLDSTSDAYAPFVNTSMTEVCDGYDTDCDNNGTPPTDEQDTDGDTYLSCDNWVATSSSGFTDGHDCLEISTGTNSYSDNVNPGQSEACDGYDTDCSVYVGGGANSSTAEQADETDTDGDGYLSCDNYVGASTSAFTDGHDCFETADTYSSEVNPGESEACDGYDTNCSVYVGGGSNTSAADASDEQDEDTDGYLSCDNWVAASTASFTAGHDCLEVALATNAYSNSVNPGVSEVCDGYDTNCSVYVAGGANTSAADASDELDEDTDGYLSCDNWVSASTAAFTDGHDCLEIALATNAYSNSVNPGVSEACDGYDTNCSVYVGGGANTSAADASDEQDEDTDGYLSCDNWVSASTAAFTDGHDCLEIALATNAYSNDVNPGEAEACDGYDTNCSVYVGGGANTSAPDQTNEIDTDTDTYIACSSYVASSTASLAGGLDCMESGDSYSSEVNPGESEACDGYDTDCSAAGVVPSDEDDADDDQYIECTTTFIATTTATNSQSEALVGNSDCNDAEDFTYPTAPELCDAIDNDCNGPVDDGLDADGDLVTTCGPDGIQGNSDDDCGPSDATVLPGATELCDGQLNDCNGSMLAGEVDADGDQSSVCSLDSGGWDGAGTVTQGDDCDDTDATVEIGATELCDGQQNDCNGTIGAGEVDADGDQSAVCTLDAGGWDGAGTVTQGDDCDDTDATVEVGATELCDGQLNDCSGTIGTGEVDVDLDQSVICTLDAGGWDGAGTVTQGDDCDDTDATVEVGATELCDGQLNDCNGTIGVGEVDVDLDQSVICTLDAGGWDGAGTVTQGDDCDDTDATVEVGATELCDGQLNDCNGTIGVGEVDVDLDQSVICTLDAGGWDGAGTVTQGDDCDDTDATVEVGATELCDGQLNDCNGTIGVDEVDVDLDQSVICTLDAGGWDGAGTVTQGGDCDDTDATVEVGATELCDGQLNDCNGTIGVDEVDVDLDQSVICTLDAGGWDGAGTVTQGDDCDDTDATVEVGATELCDGQLNDCNGTIGVDEVDVDLDQSAICTLDAGGWDGAGTVTQGDDCDDTDATVEVGATELCDGQLNDCNGTIGVDEVDVDLDQSVICTLDAGGWDGAGTVTQGDDCDDTDGTIEVGATELCDGQLNDCNGTIGAGEVDVDLDQSVICTLDAGGWDGAGTVTQGDDCDDTDATVEVGATELCDGQLNACGGTIGANEVDVDLDEFTICTLDAGGWDGAGTVTGGDDCDDTVGTTYPFAGDAAAGGGDTDCDGLDCIAGAGTAGTAYDGTNGPYYTYCATSGNNAAAVTACEQTLGGYNTRLAQTDGSTDNDEIFALIVTTSTTGTAWIGATDTTADDTFAWDAGSGNDATGVDGLDATPDFVGSTNGTTDCLTVSETGAWAETDCTTSPTGFVCEVP